MRAGFARVKINPPPGTPMLGWAARDLEHGCEKVHDDIFVRAVYVEHKGRQVIIMGFDVCFLGRPEVDRYKGAIGRVMDLPPSSILINTSHSHLSPATWSWSYADSWSPVDPMYIYEIELAAVRAAVIAREAASAVHIFGAEGRTNLPISRRLPRSGAIEFLPNQDGVIYDYVPICLFKDLSGKPVGIIFSVSCHPSMKGGWEISAEYPGAAMKRLDAYLGTAGSLFLQGAGGDAKPRLGADVAAQRWIETTWQDVERAGDMVAAEVIRCVEQEAVPLEPEIRACAIEMAWPLAVAPGRSEWEQRATQSAFSRILAEKHLQRIARWPDAPESVPVTAHGIQLAKGMRLIGLEGEMVAGLGHLIRQFYGSGITFPLGYSNGAQLYLPTESMLSEGGYEVTSYYQFGVAAPLATGFERVLLDTLRQMKARGIR